MEVKTPAKVLRGAMQGKVGLGTPMFITVVVFCTSVSVLDSATKIISSTFSGAGRAEPDGPRQQGVPPSIEA